MLVEHATSGESGKTTATSIGSERGFEKNAEMYMALLSTDISDLYMALLSTDKSYGKNI